jgi:hypothetical protein
MYSYDRRSQQLRGRKAYADPRAQIDRRPAAQFLNGVASSVAEIGESDKRAYPTLNNIARRIEREGADPMARKVWARQLAKVAGQLLQNSGQANRIWKTLVEADITVK